MGQYLFSSHGRVNRAKFWVLQLFALGVVFANAVAIGLFERYAYGRIGIPTHWDIRLVAVFGLFLPIYAILLCAFVAVAIKRLHDRGKSGIWLLIVLFTPFLVFAIDDPSTTSNVALSAAMDLLGFAVWIWGFVELGLLPGTEGNNVYGDDPLGTQNASR